MLPPLPRAKQRRIKPRHRAESTSNPVCDKPTSLVGQIRCERRTLGPEWDAGGELGELRVGARDPPWSTTENLPRRHPDLFLPLTVTHRRHSLRRHRIPMRTARELLDSEHRLPPKPVSDRTGEPVPRRPPGLHDRVARGRDPDLQSVLPHTDGDLPSILNGRDLRPRRCPGNTGGNAKRGEQSRTFRRLLFRWPNRSLPRLWHSTRTSLAETARRPSTVRRAMRSACWLARARPDLEAGSGDGAFRLTR